MSKAKVRFIQAKRLAINFSTVCSSVAVGTQGDEVLILMLFNFFPRFNVMNIDLDVAAGRYCTSVARFDQDTSPYFCWNGWPVVAFHGKMITKDLWLRPNPTLGVYSSFSISERFELSWATIAGQL